MRRNACIVDHSSHQTTHSFDFFRDIVSQEFDLYEFWDDAWNGGQHVPVEQLNEYETIFFFQSINPLEELSRIRGNMIWLPMYDDAPRRRAFWLKLSTLSIKVVCFSKKLHQFVSHLGISSMAVQYYRCPQDFKQMTDFKTRRVFFWPRGGIGFDTLSGVLGDNKIDSMDIRWAPDPNVQMMKPNENLAKKYNISITNGFLNREGYFSLVMRNNVFIAPRLNEGIGLSTLEALTMGQCVIAHNDSTMNEYISDGQDGLLFDAECPRQIDLSNFEMLGRKARERCVKGWEQWQGDIQRLREFILAPPPKKRSETACLRLYILWVTIVDIIRKRITIVRRILKTKAKW